MPDRDATWARHARDRPSFIDVLDGYDTELCGKKLGQVMCQQDSMQE